MLYTKRCVKSDTHVICDGTYTHAHTHTYTQYIPNNFYVDKFTFPKQTDQSESYWYAGMRFHAPNDKIFIPAVFCKLIVKALEKFSVSFGFLLFS